MTTREPKSTPNPDPAPPGPAVPAPDGMPRPVDAMAVGFDQRFVRAVAVALMRVIQDGAPEIGPTGAQMARYIVGNPEEQARRFAVALASDPDVVTAALATNDNPGEVAGGLSVLTERVRSLWSVMAGNTEQPVGFDPASAGPGAARGKS